jgi:hypothetical protein
MEVMEVKLSFMLGLLYSLRKEALKSTGQEAR